jgi:hypothetical protein
MEINSGQVETVLVDQSIAGRVFDFGTVEIRGTGSTSEPISKVEAPLALRKAIGTIAKSVREARR